MARYKKEKMENLLLLFIVFIIFCISLAKIVGKSLSLAKIAAIVSGFFIVPIESDLMFFAMFFGLNEIFRRYISLSGDYISAGQFAHFLYKPKADVGRVFVTNVVTPLLFGDESFKVI